MNNFKCASSDQYNHYVNIDMAELEKKVLTYYKSICNKSILLDNEEDTPEVEVLAESEDGEITGTVYTISGVHIGDSVVVSHYDCNGNTLITKAIVKEILHCVDH